MKIHISKTIQIPEIPSEVEIETGTLRTLLDKLLRNSYFAKEITDLSTGELALDGLIRVQLNDVYYDSLPKGLDSELRDGDRLTLTLIFIGGG